MLLDRMTHPGHGGTVPPASSVEQTGYVTVAERSPDPAEFSGAGPALLTPG
jgi:hypothetical protein